jgi:2-desacetyl-2-hydroxyethyl bacteriochlorophyllide A dehydrogenase
MQAAVIVGPRQIVLGDVAKPRPRPGEAIIQVGACGICGSDISFYNGVPDYTMQFPAIAGHEMAGIVDEINGHCEGLEVGDRVAIEPLINCSRCYACRVGEYNCCANLEVIGAHVPGGFAEFVAVPAHRCHKMPASMPMHIGAACEPYSIGANVVRRGQVTKEDVVVVNGAGAIGLTVVDMAKNVLGARVLVTDLLDSRLERAQSLGADEVVNVGREDTNQRIMEFTHGEGASVVVEATGQPGVISNLPNQVAPAGRCVIVGYSDSQVCFNGAAIIRKEMTILGSRNSCNAYPGVIQMVTSGRLHPEKLVTHRFGIDEIEEAFRFSAEKPELWGKVVVEFGL